MEKQDNGVSMEHVVKEGIAAIGRSNRDDWNGLEGDNRVKTEELRALINSPYIQRIAPEGNGLEFTRDPKFYAAVREYAETKVARDIFFENTQGDEVEMIELPEFKVMEDIMIQKLDVLEQLFPGEIIVDTSAGSNRITFSFIIDGKNNDWSLEIQSPKELHKDELAEKARAAIAVDNLRLARNIPDDQKIYQAIGDYFRAEDALKSREQVEDLDAKKYLIDELGVNKELLQDDLEERRNRALEALQFILPDTIITSNEIRAEKYSGSLNYLLVTRGW